MKLEDVLRESFSTIPNDFEEKNIAAEIWQRIHTRDSRADRRDLKRRIWRASGIAASVLAALAVYWGGTHSPKRPNAALVQPRPYAYLVRFHQSLNPGGFQPGGELDLHIENWPSDPAGSSTVFMVASPTSPVESLAIEPTDKSLSGVNANAGTNAQLDALGRTVLQEAHFPQPNVVNVADISVTGAVHSFDAKVDVRSDGAISPQGWRVILIRYQWNSDYTVPKLLWYRVISPDNSALQAISAALQTKHVGKHVHDVVIRAWKSSGVFDYMLVSYAADDGDGQAMAVVEHQGTMARVLALQESDTRGADHIHKPVSEMEIHERLPSGTIVTLVGGQVLDPQIQTVSVHCVNGDTFLSFVSHSVYFSAINQQIQVAQIQGEDASDHTVYTKDMVG